MTIKPLDVYSVMRSLEAKTRSLCSVVELAKRASLHDGDGDLPELVTLSAEMRWQLRQLDQSVIRMQSALGIDAGGEAQRPESAGEPDRRRETSTLRGNTAVVSVADLLGMLSSLGKTGTLTLQADDTVCVFELQEGRVVHAVTNHPDADMRLGTILVAQNKLSEQQLDESLAQSRARKDLLGNVLVRSATVSQQDLRMALDEQVHRIFVRAFGLQRADFTFLEGCVSKLHQRTSVNTIELLLEAARQLDEQRSGGGGAADGGSANVLDDVLKG